MRAHGCVVLVGGEVESWLFFEGDVEVDGFGGHGDFLGDADELAGLFGVGGEPAVYHAGAVVDDVGDGRLLLRPVAWRVVLPGVVVVFWRGEEADVDVRVPVPADERGGRGAGEVSCVGKWFGVEKCVFENAFFFLVCDPPDNHEEIKTLWV